MMKKIIFSIIFFSSFFIISCNENKAPEKNREADSLALINSDLYKKLAAQDSTSKMFMGAFNEIQDNLDSIKMKEKMIIESSRAEDTENKKEQIKQSIQSIYEFMARNRGAIASLSAKLKRAQMNGMQADSTIAEMQKVIERLTAQVDSKDKELAELKGQLEKLKIDIDGLTTNLKTKEEESTQKTVELNTAYYLTGVSKELIKKGIIAKEGGFIGMGKSMKVQNNLRKDMFTQIDITKTTSIALNCKKATILSTHPQGTFKIVGDEKAKKVDKLEITNPKEFWSTSKYLVIEVK